MSPDHACSHAREMALEAVGAPVDATAIEHLADCPACALWLRRTHAAQAALHSLPRLQPPARLLQETQGAVQRAQRLQRLEGCLGAIERELAPEELDRRVARLFAGSEESKRPAAQDRVAGALDDLPRQRAPHVLERLVREELEAPALHRSRRFAGDLERQAVPGELAPRVASQVREVQRLRRRTLSLWSSLAAAVLLISWFVLPERGAAPKRRLQLVQVSSPAQLDPLARGFLDGASGGRLSARSEL